MSKEFTNTWVLDWVNNNIFLKQPEDVLSLKHYPPRLTQV